MIFWVMIFTEFYDSERLRPCQLRGKRRIALSVRKSSEAKLAFFRLWTSGGRRSQADLVALVQLLDQEGSFASPPRDFQSGPAGAGGGPAHEAIRPLSCAPVLPRRCRRIDLSRKCL